MSSSQVLNLILAMVIIVLLVKSTWDSDAEQTGPMQNVNLNIPEEVLKDTLHQKISLGKRPMLWPKPTAVVGSYNEKGVPNIMTAAWAGIVNSRPPKVAVSLRPATYSHGNVSLHQAFTVNVPREDQAQFMDFAGEFSGRDMNKFEVLGLTPVKSALVNAPYVKEFPIVLECKVTEVHELGSHTQFVGEILDAKVNKTCTDDNGKLVMENARPVIFGQDGYYGYGKYLGRPGKMHRELNIDMSEYLDE